MLVLSRKRDQKIMIGNQICLTVVDIRGDTVQLGIDAPRKIPIYREEIYSEIVAANAAALLDDQSLEKDLGALLAPDGELEEMEGS